MIENPLSMIAVMALVTLLLRTLPFILFQKRRPFTLIEDLGAWLPYAMMGMLVVYCLKDLPSVAMTHAFLQIGCVMLVVLLHVWKRNTLFSIVLSTLCYMILLPFC